MEREIHSCIGFCLYSSIRLRIFLDFKMDFTSVSHSLSMDLSIEKVLREVPVMHWRVLPS